MEEKSNSYFTFNQYLLRSGNENKSFNDYLVDYFEAKAVPLILLAIKDSQLGMLSRITNDLSTPHPELSHSRIVDQFITAVDWMEEVEQEYKVDVLKRWFLASVNIIIKLFLNKDGKIKDKFLATLIGKDNFNTITDIKAALYGNPEDPEQVASVAELIVSSATVAITQPLADDKRICELELYRDRAYGMPEDEIRLFSFTTNLTLKTLNEFMVEDFYLCRIKLVKILNEVLINLNAKSSPENQIENLSHDLYRMYDQIIMYSPIAGTVDYNEIFNCYFRLLVEVEDKLSEKNPIIADDIHKTTSLWQKCFNDLRTPQGTRGACLSDFQTALKEILNSTQSRLHDGDKSNIKLG